MLFNRAFRHAKPGGYIALGQALNLTQHENLTAPTGQCFDRSGYLLEFHAFVDQLVGERLGRLQFERANLMDRADRHDPGSPQILEDDRVGSLEQIGTRIADLAHCLKHDEPGIGFLDDVIDVEADMDTPAQPGAQATLVRQDVP